VGSRVSAYHYNAVKDFQGSTPGTPLATLADLVVTDASCGSCHGDSANRTSLRFRNFESTDATANVHGGNRFETGSCSVCHNSSWFSSTASTDTQWVTELDLPQLAHKLHQGNDFPTYLAGTFKEIDYFPQPITNCTTCHNNQASLLAASQPTGRSDENKTAFLNRISRFGCSGCHSGNVDAGMNVNFADHFGNQVDDKNCALCHNNVDGFQKVAETHPKPANQDVYSTPNSPAIKAGGADLVYSINSVTLNATRQPVVKFLVQYKTLDAKGLPTGNYQNLNVKALPAGWTISGAAFIVAWSGDDAVNSTPADFNNAGVNTVLVSGLASGGRTYFGNPALTNTRSTTSPFPVTFTAISPVDSTFERAAYDQPLSVSLSAMLPVGNTVGTVSDPDPTTGYQTATIFRAVPANTTLTMVAMESHFTMNGNVTAATAALKGLDNLSSTTVNETAVSTRRYVNATTFGVVDVNQCLLCHEQNLGFHNASGRRNNPDHCAMCHNTENTSSNTFAGCVWLDPTLDDPATASPVGKWVPDPTCAKPGHVKVASKPMNLKDMVHALHAAGLTEGEAIGEFSFIRGNPNSGSGGTGVYEFAEVRFPNRLDNCESCHKPGTYDVDLVPNVRSTVYSALPGLSLAGPWPMTGPSFAEQMVRKLPITAACSTCHDGDGDIAHYATNTSTALGVESCDVCHGPGRTADAVEAHAERNQ
jgi:hypothetical protein